MIACCNLNWRLIQNDIYIDHLYPALPFRTSSLEILSGEILMWKWWMWKMVSCQHKVIYHDQFVVGSHECHFLHSATEMNVSSCLMNLWARMSERWYTWVSWMQHNEVVMHKMLHALAHEPMCFDCTKACIRCMFSDLNSRRNVPWLFIGHLDISVLLLWSALH